MSENFGATVVCDFEYEVHQANSPNIVRGSERFWRAQR
jgi:hypothetical protein